MLEAFVLSGRFYSSNKAHTPESMISDIILRVKASSVHRQSLAVALRAMCWHIKLFVVSSKEACVLATCAGHQEKAQS